MPKYVWLVIAIAFVFFVFGALRGGRGKRRPLGEIRAKKLLSEREQPMFWRLQQAFPNDVVLCQVAFAALITAKDQATRATFNRKFADFVLATKAFEVLAVIELDDSSHRGREMEDNKRDTLLETAGYRVLRFARVPDVDELRQTVHPAPMTTV